MRAAMAACGGLMAVMLLHSNVEADDINLEQLSQCAAIEKHVRATAVL